MLKRDQIYLSATQKDTEAALSLMEGLERFDVPKSLEVAPGMEAMARRRRVMRHGQENSRSTDLPELVREKLAESAVMVLVCSSSSSTSRWIRAELEEFYRTHPRGPIVPVVLDGEPDPDHSKQAFEKPCFPENLKKADIDRWVDGRGTDWAETAPVAALAALLGVRVEQVIHHEALQAKRMRKQRSLALTLALSVLCLAVLWTMRWPLHHLARQELTIYAERWAPSVQTWMESMEPVGAPAVRKVNTPPVSSPETAAAPVPSAEGAGAPGPVPAGGGKAEAGMFTTLPKSDPVAYQIAANAWLDEAEKHLPDQLDQAEHWIGRAKEGLALGDGVDFGNELYRVHALAAVVAQRRRDFDRSSQELLKAIGHWISIPIQDLEKREEEGFNILATIAPTQEWRESAAKMVAWLGSLPGDESKVSQRAGRLIDLVELHPFLAGAVEEWLAGAAARTQPAPSDGTGTSAKFAMLRADLLRSRGNRQDALAALEEGEKALTASANPESMLHRALGAQFRYRKGEYAESAVAPAELEKNLNEIQQGQATAGWEGWFGDDLRRGWDRLGDMQLREDAYVQAIGAYNRALEFSKNPAELASILLKSGCAYRYQGDAAGAWDAFSLAIPIFEEARNDSLLLTALQGAVLAARDLKRTKEGAELAQRASQLQAKLGSSYQPPSYWRTDTAAVLPPVQQQAPAVAQGGKGGAPANTAAVAAVASVTQLPPPEKAAQVQVVTAKEGADTKPKKEGAGTPAENAGELEARIVTVQKKIAQLEADSKNRQTFRGLEELQNLYAELDSLLRRKLTGNARN